MSDIQNDVYRVFQIDYRENQKDAAEMMAGFQPEGSVSKGALKRLDMYRPVAVIPARNLEEVFAFGNHQGGGVVIPIEPMHSVSVGDIVMDEDDKVWVVASGGYEKLDAPDDSTAISFFELSIRLELDAAQAMVFRYLRLAAFDLGAEDSSEEFLNHAYRNNQ